VVKKILLSLIVIISFTLYSIFERQQAKDSAALVKTSGDTTTSNPTPNSSSASGLPPINGDYKDGIYVGSTEDVFYGDIQIRATIASGRLDTIEFLKYPNDQKTSIMINTQMMPILIQEAIQKQSSEVDIVSGATDSSEGFRRSLANALGQAK
jgi:uncharacterized protein with FMN-binding domain